MTNHIIKLQLGAMSVRRRAAISILANALRAGIGFVTGMLLARELSPQGYGELTFLIGTFVAARALLDVGISNAFFTFISQQPRSWRLYLFYSVTQFLQFSLLLLLVMLLIPDSLLKSIWVGAGERNQVLLALCASFMQQSVWQAIVQIGEAARRTLLVQCANLAIAVVSLSIVVCISTIGYMSVFSMLLAISILHLTASLLVGSFLATVVPISAEHVPFRSIAFEFWQYCRPMLMLSLFGGIYLFADKWLLQAFGGAIQQGYFQVATQFSLIAILVTTSVLGVFGKEIAEASATGNSSRVAMLYKYATRILVVLSASLAGVIVPWSEEIILHFLGADYTQSWTVVAVMLICPIYQSLSQINGAFLMAISRTKLFSAIGTFGMLISLPLSYWAVAPHTATVPGLEMGALGIALKEVSTTIVMAGIQSFFIAASQGWRIDLAFQFAATALLLLLGYLAKLFVSGAMGAAAAGQSKVLLLVSVSLSALIVLVVLIVVGWCNRRALAPFIGSKRLLFRHPTN